MSKRYYARPNDGYLQAFKDWIRGMVGNLGGDSKITMSEEEWIAQWKEFWDKAEADRDTSAEEII